MKESVAVLLAESDPAQRKAAQMALHGAGRAVDVVGTVREGEAKLDEANYGVLVVDGSCLPLARIAHERDSDVHIVFTSSASEPQYLSVLEEYPYISNIVSRFGKKRLFTVKNLVPTVSKLTSGDLFGLEKYLAWGTHVREARIATSAGREAILGEVEEYLQQAGVRSRISRAAVLVADEMLMNLVYDAPTDRDGQPRYNHLPRSERVDLLPEEYGTFRFACDGYWVAISAEDCFGALERSTVIEYLYQREGFPAPPRVVSAGGGLGLFEINRQSEMLVINVEPERRTEIISLIPVECTSDNICSLHYFSV